MVRVSAAAGGCAIDVPAPAIKSAAIPALAIQENSRFNSPRNQCAVLIIVSFQCGRLPSLEVCRSLLSKIGDLSISRYRPGHLFHFSGSCRRENARRMPTGWIHWKQQYVQAFSVI
jgi:hypothetical protein